MGLDTREDQAKFVLTIIGAVLGSWVIVSALTGGGLPPEAWTDGAELLIDSLEGMNEALAFIGPNPVLWAL